MPELKELGFNISTTDVTLTTTSETTIITSDEVYIPGDTAELLVLGFAELTTGAATTTVLPRIRAGVGTAGTVLSDGVAQAVKAAAGSTEPFVSWAIERVRGVDTVRYTLTLQQAGATGNGTATQATIVVFVL